MEEKWTRGLRGSFVSGAGWGEDVRCLPHVFWLSAARSSRATAASP